MNNNYNDVNQDVDHINAEGQQLGLERRWLQEIIAENQRQIQQIQQLAQLAQDQNRRLAQVAQLERMIEERQSNLRREEQARQYEKDFLSVRDAQGRDTAKSLFMRQNKIKPQRPYPPHKESKYKGR